MFELDLDAIAAVDNDDLDNGSIWRRIVASQRAT
jgi:hypothetical protein